MLWGNFFHWKINVFAEKMPELPYTKKEKNKYDLIRLKLIAECKQWPFLDNISKNHTNVGKNKWVSFKCVDPLLYNYSAQVHDKIFKKEMLNVYSPCPPWGAQSALQIFPQQAIAFHIPSQPPGRHTDAAAGSHASIYILTMSFTAHVPLLHLGGVRKMVAKCFFQGHQKHLRSTGGLIPGPSGFEMNTLLTELFRHLYINRHKRYK